MRTIRIGAGAGFSGDRIEPAVELARQGELDYLCFECLAERTVALAQAERLRDASRGYDPLLASRMEAVLPLCLPQGMRIITNMGAANPAAAAKVIADIARRLGFTGVKVAAVTGDDVLDAIRGSQNLLMERPGTVASLGDNIVSANAYLGIEPIVRALQSGADIVVTGRVADPALFAAPLIHEFGWTFDDWTRLGQATVIGHLLECAGQVTGGYFADAGRKFVGELARLGFPLAEVSEDGSAVLTKVPGSGGRISLAICKEQLLYEVLDPASYLQPDVTADFSSVRFTELSPDRIAVDGGGGRQRPDKIKVSIGYLDGYLGEGQISYAGANATARGRLALTGVETGELRLELIGVDAISSRLKRAEAPEVRARVVGRTASLEAAARIGNEVEALYTNGPAGGGGVARATRKIIAIASTLIARELVAPSVSYEVS